MLHRDIVTYPREDTVLRRILLAILFLPVLTSKATLSSTPVKIVSVNATKRQQARSIDSSTMPFPYLMLTYQFGTTGRYLLAFETSWELYGDCRHTVRIDSNSGLVGTPS